MSRRRRAVKRSIKPDPRYDSVLVARLINLVMQSGKKTLAQKIVYKSLELVSEKLEKGDPIDILLGALENTRPKIEVKSRRVGGATYQVPVEISFDRQQSLAFRWMLDAVKRRKGESAEESLAEQILNAYNGEGEVVKKKEETHRMAQANKAFAHLRW